MTGVIIFIVLTIILWWALQHQASFYEGGNHGHDDHAAADDLKKIEGIGPKVAKLLAGAGYASFEALAKAKPADLEKVLDAEGSIYSAMDPTSWPKQAKLAAKGDWEALEKLQDELTGGR